MELHSWAWGCAQRSPFNPPTPLGGDVIIAIYEGGEMEARSCHTISPTLQAARRWQSWMRTQAIWSESVLNHYALLTFKWNKRVVLGKCLREWGWEWWNHSESIVVWAQGGWHSGIASHWSGGRNLCFVSQLEIRLKCAFPWEKTKSEVNTTEVEWFERLEFFWRTGLNRAWKGARFLNQGVRQRKGRRDHWRPWNAIGPKS